MWPVKDSAATHDSTVGHVLALNAGLRQALLDRDMETLDRLYAPEFAINSPAGRIQSRRETLDLLTRTNMRQLDHERTIEAAYASGQDAVVIMGRESLVWGGTGTELDGRRTARRFTNVWRRADGEWRHVARQATTVRIDDETP